MSRSIIENVKLAARYFPGDAEAVNDVFIVEVRLRAEEAFGEGERPSEAFSSILGELPVSVEQKDENRILALVMDEWNYFKLMGGRGM